MIPLSISGHYRIRVLGPDLKIKTDTGWFKNLILLAGRNRMGSGAWLGTCALGSGITTPSENQTALETLVASSTTLQSNVAGASQSAPYYGYRRQTYRFAAGTAAGNLSEVGVGWGASTLFSRALILAPDGSLATITVLPGETIDVTFEVRILPPEEVVTTVTLAGSSRTLTVRPASITSGSDRLGWGVAGTVVQSENTSGYRPVAYNGALGAITSTPSGTSGAAGSLSNEAYSNNSYQRSVTATWSQSEGNLSGGISSLLLSTNGLGRYQMSVDPPIAKTNEKTLVMSFLLSWTA